MATTTNTARINAAGGLALDHIPDRGAVNEIWEYATYEVTTAELATADIIQMLPVASGATILEVILACDDLDGTASTAALVLDVGDAGDADRFIDGSTAGQGGGVTRLNSVAGLLFQYTTDDTIDITVQAGANFAVAGTMTLAVCMSFANLDSL